MHIVIENAGAEKGLLLLPHKNRWFIEAQGSIDKQEVTVLQSIMLDKCTKVAETIINHVAKTKKSVVLSDATRKNSFSQDCYIIKHHPKSLLCLPLLNHGQISAILYLENNLTVAAFTP